MTHSDLFDTSAALMVLDVISSDIDLVRLPSLDTSWEIVWIACLTSSHRWARDAEQKFADVLTELGLLIRPDHRHDGSAPAYLSSSI